MSINSETNWRNPFGIALVVYYLVMAVVGMCIPDDILQTHAGARQFSDFMASIVPQIDRLTAINIKPEVNRFYFSVLWAGSPVLFTICAFLVWYGQRLNYPIWTTQFLKSLWPMLVNFGFVLWSQYLWAVGGTGGLSKALFGNSFGRSFFAQIVFHAGPSLLLVGTTIWLIGWASGYIPNRIGNAKR